MEMTEAIQHHSFGEQDHPVLTRHCSNDSLNTSSTSIELEEQTVGEETSLIKAEPHNDRGRIVLVGSGDMTRALVTNLVRAGYRPVVATRKVDRARTWFTSDEVEVRTVAEGLSVAGELVVVAIPAQHHYSLPSRLLCNKIVVDISNRAADNSCSCRRPKKPSGGPSLAEELQDMLPESHVVKAFNTLSAYVLQRPDLSGSRQVPVCGDQVWARERVSALVRQLGLTPVDMGGLSNARALEDIPHSFFPEWKVAVILGGVVFAFFLLLRLFRKMCPNFETDGPLDWTWLSTLPINTIQVVFADAACTLLLSCYVPGIIAAYLQLWRGTKYSQFPSWLDNWLKARKQLGLMALLLGATHACLAIFHKIMYGVGSSWQQQAYLTCGVLLLAVMVVLGITSLPSVSSTLSWREFSGVQRYLGWASVVLLTAHNTICNLHSLFRAPVCAVLTHSSQILVPLCLLTVALKVPLVVPCVDSHLTRIRRGYERS